MRLTVSCDATLPTKGEEIAGLTPYNENRIETIDFFFYPGENPDPDLDAVCHVKVTETPVRQITASHTLKLNASYMDQIFPDGTTKATVFAVVNYPGTLVNESTLSGTSREALEAIVVRTDFLEREENDLQPNFLMSGSSVIDLIDRNADMVATGTVRVARHAAKLTVSIHPEETILLDSKNTPDNPEDDEIWHPVLSSLEIYLVDGVNTVLLGGENTGRDESAYFSYRNKSRRYFRDETTPCMAPSEVTRETGGEETTTTYYNTYPMYTYPMHWDYGVILGNKKAPSLKLIITWKRDNANGHSFVERQYYYKIFIPDDPDGEGDDKRSFRRNNWYHYDLDVGILGSETDEGAVRIDPSCYIVDWQNLAMIRKQANVGSARFLSVDRDTVLLHNVSSTVSIPYITSHPVRIVPGSIRATRPYYGEKTSGNALGGTIRKAGEGDIYPQGSYYLEFNEQQRKNLNDGREWLNDLTGSSIQFQHTLKNDYTQEQFDYSPYTVTFSIDHADRPGDPHYTRTLTIVQYPGIYIEALANSDNTVTGPANNHQSDHWGYVFVDNQQLVRQRDISDEAYKALTGEEKSYWHWHLIWYSDGSRDIFKINATTLPENSDFVIGDPRSTTVNNLDYPFKKGPHIDATGNINDNDWQMSWYYPTENSWRTYDMIAPGYRVASKHGGVEFGGVTYEEAQYRCASYQEDGFPAGRWRIPTRGEIRFIAMLSANRAFTFLFSFGGTYWSANGCIKVEGNTVVDQSVSTALVRCVYDSWYWGDEQHNPRDQFVWGDQKIVR